MTCNAGIKLLSRPDYYFAIDQKSGTEFQELARAAQAAGTVCVTLSRDMRAMKERCVDWFDLHLTLPPQGDPVKNGYGAFRYSGPLCVQFACNNGAERVILAGCDGYREDRGGPRMSGSYWDYDEREFPPRRSQWATDATREVVAPQMRMIAQAWDDVEFIQVGDPCYTVGTPNWKVVPLDAVDLHP